MNQPSNRATMWLLTKLFLVLATCGAAYLLIVALKDGHVAGCGTGSSCDSVLKTRFAYLLPGIPVTAPALFTYLVLLFGVFFKRDSEAWKGVMLVGALMVIGAAIWFTGIQAVVIKKFCKYCIATHALGVVGSLCLLRAIMPIPRGIAPLAVGAAGMGLAMLAACQYFLPQKTTSDIDLGSGIAGGATVPILGHQLAIAEVPRSGNAKSGKMMIMFFDYTCSSCRRMHGYLSRAEERFGKDNFFTILVPTPLNSDCNRHFDENIPSHRNACVFAKLALALWSLDEEKFREFDHWMIETGTNGIPPKAEDARAKALELFGSQEALDEAVNDPKIAKKIEEITEIYKSLKDKHGPAMPKLVFGNGKGMSGATETEFGFFKVLEQQLGLVKAK